MIGNPLSLLQDASASLAADLAANLRPAADVLKSHGITLEEFKRLTADPQFVEMLKDYRRQWESPMSAKKRIRMKAAIAVEEGLSELYAIFQDQGMNAANRLDAYKTMKDLSNVAPRHEPADTGQAFAITINLPGSPVEVSASKSRTIEHESG